MTVPTPSVQLQYDVAAGMRGLTRAETKNGLFQALRNFKFCVDGADSTGDSAATKIFYDSRTVAASAIDSLDLSGSLTAADGTTMVLTKVHTLIVRAAATNTNNVVIGGAASNGFVGPFGGATHTLAIQPGKTFEVSSTVGWTVTAGTGDILAVTNGGSGSVVLYDIVVAGE